MLVLTLRFLHIIFMATWFGGSLFAPGDARRTLSNEAADLELLQGRLKRYAVLGAVSALLTIVTGFGLIFALGGFKVVSPAIHIGMLVAFVMWGVGMFVVGGASRKIAAGIAEKKPRAELLGHAKRMAMGTGIFHLLWIVALGLMVFRTMLF